MTQIFEDYLEVLLDNYNESIGDDPLIREMVIAQAEDENYSRNMSENFNLALKESINKVRSEKVG